MSFLGPINDRLEIRELIESYNDAVYRRDAEAWTQTWTEDAEWDLLGNIIPKRTAIVEAWKGAMSTFSYVGFSAFPGSIEVDGTNAIARVYVRETLIGTDGSKRSIEGLYDDQLIKKDGKWRFSKRAYKILYETN